MGCGGTGIIECFCAGDFCACSIEGSVDCVGCVDCLDIDSDLDYPPMATSAEAEVEKEFLDWCLRCGGKGRILVCLDDVCDGSECAPHIDVEKWCPDCSNLATAEDAEQERRTIKAFAPIFNRAYGRD